MPPRTTTTSYAILGLLTVRPWTTYELAQQVRRSLNWFWPRAERKLYDEPKRLVASGLATAREEWTGKRRSTVYEVTPAGREELQRWLDADAAPRATEFEGLLKVFFADAGSRAQLLTTLDRIRIEAEERLARLAEMVAAPPHFAERAHLSALCLPLQLEQERAVLRWARWAHEQVEQWPSSDDPGDWDAEAERRRLHEEVLATTVAS
jgi:DNA-binding PadR family transcriptional regulator